jgi:hypothetical protein
MRSVCKTLCNYYPPPALGIPVSRLFFAPPCSSFSDPPVRPEDLPALRQHMGEKYV